MHTVIFRQYCKPYNFTVVSDMVMFVLTFLMLFYMHTVLTFGSLWADYSECNYHKLARVIPPFSYGSGALWDQTFALMNTLP